MEKLENTRVTSIEPMITPRELKGAIVNSSIGLITETRHDIHKILHGQDTKRLLIIVGPCSIHDPEAAVEYAQRLARLSDQLKDELVIVMRTYFEKPRTTVGWTGLVYDPNLDGSSIVNTGLKVSRRLLADVNNSGISCAVEFLDPNTPQYFADMVSWAAIGARTTESQIHRQLASGLSMPVGFKNSTEGDIKVAIDAIVTAQNTHTFFGINEEGQIATVNTTGNPDTHIVLRGGNKGTNYDRESVRAAIELMQKRDLLQESSRPMMIDCSHGNSAKDYRRQTPVFEDVLEQVQIRGHRIMGIMIESNLEEGRQDWAPEKQLERGVSITDACISWEETKRLLVSCAQKLQSSSL